MKKTNFRDLMILCGLALAMTVPPASAQGPLVGLHDILPVTGSLPFYGRKVAIDNDVVLVGTVGGADVDVIDFASGERTWQLPRLSSEATQWGYSVSIFDDVVAIGDQAPDQQEGCKEVCRRLALI